MSRTKGALNHKTREALRLAKNEYREDGESIMRYLLKIATDSNKPESVRLQAAKTALPYLKPALSAVEQTVIEPAATKTDEELLQSIADLICANPDLVQRALALNAQANPSVQPVESKPDLSIGDEVDKVA